MDASSYHGPFRNSKADILTRSLVINYIEEETQGKNTAIAYVYCHYKDDKTMSDVELLSSIIRQVAEQANPLPPGLAAFRDAHLRRKPTSAEWILLLKSIRPVFDTLFVCIDALVHTLARPSISQISRSNSAI